MNKSYVDIIVGGQAGSEGKGAITAHLARKKDYTGAVRCGGSNAGHTVYDEKSGKEYINQVLPVPGIVDSEINLYVGAESFFGLNELKKEINRLKKIHNEEQSDRIHIDPKAAIVSEKHRNEEKKKKLGEDIGSTTHGIGAARVNKIWRSAGDIELAEDINELSEFVSEERVYSLLREEESVILEGTQGTLLSMNQSDYYPNTTSQDCIASSFLSSAGLPPTACRDIWCVYRTYPIRVAGDSGKMDGEEISFKHIQKESGLEEEPEEYTSVTGRKRRIFKWSNSQFKKSLEMNNPNKIAITFIDYINAEDYGKSKYKNLSNKSKEFIQMISKRTQAEIKLIKTGEKPSHIIENK